MYKFDKFEIPDVSIYIKIWLKKITYVTYFACYIVFKTYFDILGQVNYILCWYIILKYRFLNNVINFCIENLTDIFHYKYFRFCQFLQNNLKLTTHCYYLFTVPYTIWKCSLNGFLDLFAENTIVQIQNTWKMLM